MLSGLEWVVGFLPFGFIAVLLWVRLRAGNASPSEALKSIAVFSLGVGVIISALAIAADKWKSQNFTVAGLGALMAVFAFVRLRRFLVRLWERFPLPEELTSNTSGE